MLSSMEMIRNCVEIELSSIFILALSLWNGKERRKKNNFLSLFFVISAFSHLWFNCTLRNDFDDETSSRNSHKSVSVALTFWSSHRHRTLTFLCVFAHFIFGIFSFFLFFYLLGKQMEYGGSLMFPQCAHECFKIITFCSFAAWNISSKPVNHTTKTKFTQIYTIKVDITQKKTEKNEKKKRNQNQLNGEMRVFFFRFIFFIA